MLNYVWLGLLFLGIGAALATDFIDYGNDTYRNGEPLQVTLRFDNNIDDSEASSLETILSVKAEDYNFHYNQSLQKDFKCNAIISFDSLSDKSSIYFRVDDDAPVLWKEMAKASGEEDDLSGFVTIVLNADSTLATGALLLEDVSFAKMKEVTNSAIDYAKIAVEIALGLIGIMALWLGIM